MRICPDSLLIIGAGIADTATLATVCGIFATIVRGASGSVGITSTTRVEGSGCLV